MAPKKRVLTLREKVEIINSHNNEKLSVRALAVKFQIGKTQAANIIKQKEEILRKFASNANVNQKRSFFKIEGYNIDKLVYEWFVKARSKNIPLSGTIIRSKAREIAEQLNYENFNASSGWLERFKSRHNITFKTISGESASVNPDDVVNFTVKLPDLLRGYNPKDIYNADETGLFFRALPDKTFAFKGEKCAGGKMAKERLTIMPCVNMAGDSEKLLVIGKAARPRAFRKLNLNTLPVVWRSNKKAWMTCDIMTEFLQQFDDKMGKEKRKILLFLDNAASHPRELRLKNIKVIFLPPNTTAFCQPLDQGIIKNFKTWYRSIILKHILTRMDNVASSEELVKSINLLDVIYFIRKAWEQVTPATIQNCFKKAGFTSTPLIASSAETDFNPEDDLPLAAMAEMLKMMSQSAINIDFEDYVNVDKNLSFEDGSLVINFDNIENIELQDESEDEDDFVEIEGDNSIKTYKDAMSVVKQMKTFASRSGDTKAFELSRDLEQHFENILVGKKFHQTTMLDFFSPLS